MTLSNAMNVRVGDHRQASVVTINGEVIEAAAGQDSHANLIKWR